MTVYAQGRQDAAIQVELSLTSSEDDVMEAMEGLESQYRDDLHSGYLASPRSETLAHLKEIMRENPELRSAHLQKTLAPSQNALMQSLQDTQRQ